ncbi:hypothetical protein SEUBUCD646_0E01920 [Saccharomyces eubayanus]|uniref:RTT105-like protein n=1 Tax=Saccharomyces eubayanus TaxID=1080349 RepID=A0ABN8VUV8_SACEU|nr:hypothetical protein SEUBUCD650_0E01960 [Saccharomyces eubayanus]CAI1986701.1 hypothetical protein SEUBUCD646_0E01920 [Saccharomyces eubayanus]
MYSNHALNPDGTCFNWDQMRLEEQSDSNLSSNGSITPKSVGYSMHSRLSEKRQQENDALNIQDSPSIVSSVISNRRDRAQEVFGPHSSSPIATSEQQRINQRSQLVSMRSSKRQQRMTEKRGGLEKMEQMIMQGERLREIERLKQEAQRNAVPSDMAEFMEWENNEDLEDDDLLAFIEKQESYKKELEQLLNNPNRNAHANNLFSDYHT